MTPAQNQLYWREWGKVVRAAKGQGTLAPDRHRLHVQALGFDKSHLDFTNEDFDQVLAAFRAISEPGNLAAQLRQLDQPRRRLLYTIGRLAPAPYTRAIARDKFGSTDLDALDLAQLGQLRLTLINRARSRRLREPAPAVDTPF